MGAAQRPRPARPEAAAEVTAADPETITANERAFTVLVRNAMFRRVELVALRRWQQLADLDAEASAAMSAEDWREALEEYFAVHDSIDTGPDARGPQMLVVEAGPGAAGRCSRSSATRTATTTGGSSAEVDLDASDDEGELVMEVTGLVQL